MALPVCGWYKQLEQRCWEKVQQSPLPVSHEWGNSVDRWLHKGTPSSKTKAGLRPDTTLHWSGQEMLCRCSEQCPALPPPAWPPRVCVVQSLPSAQPGLSLHTKQAGLLHTRILSPTPGVRLNHGLVPCPFQSDSGLPCPTRPSLWFLTACGLNSNRSSLEEYLANVPISLRTLPNGSQSLLPESSCQRGPNEAESDRSHVGP